MSLKPDYFDVFLSYSHRNSDTVKMLATELKANGVNLFFDEWELKLGDIITREVEQGINLSKAGIIFFSSEALTSNWVRAEYERMIHRSITNKSFRVIPIRLENCELPDFAKDRIWYDLFEHSIVKVKLAADEVIRSLDISIKDRTGESRSGTSGLAAQMLTIAGSLSLDSDRYREYYVIASLLKSHIPSVRTAEICGCGGTVICGYVDLGATDHYDNWFHVCTKCFYHRHDETFNMMGQERSGDTDCPFCGYKWHG